MPKYYRTIIVKEILSEDPYDIAVEEDCSIQIKSQKTEEISGREMAEALTAQGSDPEFFQLDEEGNPIE